MSAPEIKEWTAAEVEKKTLRGSAAILVRQVLGQSLNVGAQIMLAKWLSPGQLGLYAIFLFLGNLFLSVAGNGLVAGLVRQPHAPTASDLTSAFRLQVGAGSALALTTLLFSPWILSHYGIQTEGIFPLACIAVSYVLLSLQGIAQARLERDLDFARMAYVELAQLLVFNTVVLVAASRGVGGLCYVYGLLGRALTGAIAFNFLRPSLRFPGGAFDRVRAVSYLKFGLPLQAVGIVSAAKDSIVPLFLTTVVGAQSVGYVSWASMVAAYPVLLLMILQRVYLPVFARLQNDPIGLGRLVETILFVTNFAIAPLALGVFVLVRPITLLVFGEKWLPALALFPCLWVANIFAPISAPLMALLNAKGRSHVSLAFALLWMALTWILGVPLILWKGALGFALANALVQLTNVALVYLGKKEAPFSFFRNAAAPWAVALVVAVPLAFVDTAWPPTSLFRLAIYAVMFGLVYFGTAGVLFRGRIRNVLALAKGT